MTVLLPEGVIPQAQPWRTATSAAAPSRTVSVPSPAAPEPTGKIGKLLAAKKSASAPASAGAADLAPPAAAPAPAGGGKMLAFLQKKRDQSQIEGPLPQVLEKLTEELRAHARMKGFKTFAEILHIKRERVAREFEKHEKNGALTPGGREAFQKELAEIERLSKMPSAEACQEDPFLKELSAMVRQGDGGLNRELSGLADELS